jgi:uncharacterized protein (TIGR02594 family)
MMCKILNKALSQYDTREIVGKQDNPEVLKYFEILGFDGQKLKDETSWCAAFVNWVLASLELPNTGKLNARSFLELGQSVKDCPEPGDIVVLWRESLDSWKGHVGFYVRETDDKIYLLGGNQGNRVSIQPYNKSRLLDIKRVK